MFNIPTDWAHILKDELSQPYFQQLEQFVTEQYKQTTVYPPKEKIFAALEHTPFDKVRVVILGQDPYHGPNQAHGLSFSVEKNVKIPPSLKNMYKELQDDLNIPQPTHGNLTKWATQGVLLLNTVLTVEAGKANSHQNQGWEKFTDAIIQKLADRKEPVIFVLWGAPAQKKEKLIGHNSQHTILKAPHPSPLSAYRGFLGSKPFSKINEILKNNPIDWKIS